jgi:AhpD family alkylhydroperoxidase
MICLPVCADLALQEKHHMAFIQTIPPDKASGLLTEVYEREFQDSGVVENGARAFSLRPAVYIAWQQLRNTIQSNMDLRRYELVTIAAASRLRCSFCTLAHGEVLRSKFFSAEQVEAIVRDYRSAGLLPAEVAMMAYAEKIVLNA